MLEYVRRLLLAQVRLAAQFDTAPQPEIREVILFSKDSELSPKRGNPLNCSYCSSVGLFGKIWAIS